MAEPLRRLDCTINAPVSRVSLERILKGEITITISTTVKALMFL